MKSDKLEEATARWSAAKPMPDTPQQPSIAADSVPAGDSGASRRPKLDLATPCQNEGASIDGLSFFKRPTGWALCLTLLIGLGVVRIVSTYHVFNHTIDEGAHVACGIEWLEKGVYRYETLHPPLARVSVALGPYLAGVRGTARPTMWAEATYILSADGHYWRNLTLARLGVLPYFVLATVLVFLWTKRLFGAVAGLLAAAIFTLMPTVLAHSGLATTDIAFTALFCCALYLFTLWLEAPSYRTALQFGIATGLAMSAKFSTIIFLPVCAAVILVTYVLSGKRNWWVLVKTAVVALLCAILVTWSIYRFSRAPLGQITTVPERVAAKLFGKSSRAAGIVQSIDARVPVPAPELLDGIRSLRQQNQKGRRNFLFGRVKPEGWWYFFVAALALKTPLAVLLLAAFGAGKVAVRYWRDRSDWQQVAPLGAAIAILLVTAPSHINIGVRHIMPMFVLLSMLAGLALMVLWERPDHRALSRVVAVLLGLWLVISSARTHPDYLSYFNELGGRDPSQLLVVSDFDWGQDLARLATYLSEHKVQHVSIAYDGYFDPAPLGLPETELMKCGETPSGWAAVEVRRARRYPECYPWLQRQHPVSTAGNTMWIYYVPGP